MSIALTVGGINIATQVYLTKSNFLSHAGPTPGTCEIAVQDETLVKSFTIGDRILLTVDGLNVWAGYLFKIRRVYPFEAYSPAHVRQFVLFGTEIGILFQKRTVYRLSNPTLDPPDYPPYTQDTTVFADLFDDYLNLSGDGIDVTTHVHNIGSINEDQKGSPIWASQPWGTTMRLMANHLSPIWGINADRKLIWADVDVESAPVGISDNPGAGEIGCANLEIMFDATEMINDALILGAGTGDDEPVWVRELAPASIDTHGRWQMGMTALQVYKQNTINKIANSWVHGSPSSHRGHKNDRVSVSCTVWEPGLRPGMVVHFVSGVWGWSDDIPIRQMRISWPATAVTRYDLVLSHELDHPLALTDPMPPIPPPQKPKPPRVIVEDGPVDCEGVDCGYTDTFTRANGGWAGPNDAGLFWGGTTNPEQYVEIFDGVGHHGFNARAPHGALTAMENVAQFLPNMGSPPWEIVVNLGFNSSAISNGLGLTFAFGYTAPTAHALTAFFGSDGALTLTRSNPSGAEEEFLPTGTFDFSTPYRVRMLATRTSLKVRLWRPTVTEPTTWNLELACTEIPSLTGYIYWASANKQYVNGVTYPQVYATLDTLNIRAGETYYNRCTKVQFDNFERVEFGTWGVATPSVLPWVTNFGGATISVDGYEGKFTLPSTGVNTHEQVYVHAATGAVAPWNQGAFTMKAKVRVTAVPTGSDYISATFTALNADALDGPYVTLQFSTPGFVSTDVLTGGVSVDTSFAFTTGRYDVLWECVPGVSSKVKVWLATDPEPAAWTLDTPIGGPTSIDGPDGSDFMVDFWGRSGAGPSLMIDSIDFAYEGRPCIAGSAHTILDTFDGRSTTSGFGTASSGLPWADTIGEVPKLSVSGGSGLMVVPVGGGSTSNPVVLTSAEYAAPFAWPAIIHEKFRVNLPASDLQVAPAQVYNAGLTSTQFTYGGTTGQTYMQYGLQHMSRPAAFGTPNGFITWVRIVAVTAPTANLLDLYIPLMFHPGIDYEAKCYVYPGQPIKLKAWISGTPEPNWMWVTSFVAYGDPIGVGTDATNPRRMSFQATWFGTQPSDFVVTRDFVDVYSEGAGVLPSSSSVSQAIEGRTCSNFDGGTDTFNVHHEIWTGTVEVSVNGVSQPTSDVTATQDGVVTLSWHTEPGDKVRICYEIRDTNQ